MTNVYYVPYGNKDYRVKKTGITIAEIKTLITTLNIAGPNDTKSFMSATVILMLVFIGYPYGNIIAQDADFDPVEVQLILSRLRKNNRLTIDNKLILEDNDLDTTDTMSFIVSLSLLTLIGTGKVISIQK